MRKKEESEREHVGCPFKYFKEMDATLKRIEKLLSALVSQTYSRSFVIRLPEDWDSDSTSSTIIKKPKLTAGDDSS